MKYRNLALKIYIIKFMAIATSLLVFDAVNPQNLNPRKYCVIKDTDDTYDLDRFITISKNNLKKNGEKISAKDSVDEWQKQMTKEHEFNGNDPCFAMTNKQADGLHPSISITTVAGLKKFRDLIRDSSVSENIRALDPIVEMVNKIKSDGFKSYCHDIVLSDTDHRYNQMLRKICELIKSQN